MTNVVADPQTKRPPARWILPQVSPADSQALSQQLGIDIVPASILAARGLSDVSAARRFLSPKLDALHDPELMQDMEHAVERVLQAIRNHEPILLYGDYDVDGTSSIVVLKLALDLLGGTTSFHIPHRIKEGYGMRTDVIDRAIAAGVRLIISVDTGIRAAAVVRHANQHSVDVIITDHHLPEAELPPAYAVLNPNRQDCRYPNKHLCGAGVTLKFVQALLAKSGLDAARQSALLDSFLKPVAIATVADIVPLTGENRVIVQRGLSGLKRVRNTGLRSLLNVCGFEDGDCPSAHQVAFRLAPRINAAGRMEDAAEIVELFLTNDSTRAQALAEKLDVLNRERQQVENEIVEQITAECENMAAHELSHALVFFGSGWHPGVLGIVASRLVEQFSRPVFVLSEASADAGGGSGLLAGSGRSIPRFHLLEALERMPHLFTRFGGHRQAAGLTLSAGNLEGFRKQFAAIASECLTPDDMCPEFRIDAHADLHQLSAPCIQQILSLGPFGFGNPNPLLLSSRVRIAGPVKVIREGKHFSVPLQKDGRVMWCKAWHFSHRAHLLTTGAELDVLFQIEDDLFSQKRGYDPWCVTLKDVRVAS